MPTNSNFAATFFEHSLMKEAVNNQTSDLRTKQKKTRENMMRERVSEDSKQTDNKGLLDSFIQKPAEDHEESRVSRDPKKLVSQEATKSRGPDQTANLLKSSNYSGYLENEQGHPTDRPNYRPTSEAYNPYKTESLMNSKLASNFSKLAKDSSNPQQRIPREDKVKLGISSHASKEVEDDPFTHDEYGRNKKAGLKQSKGSGFPGIPVKSDKQTKPSVIMEREQDLEADPELTQEDIDRNKQTAEFTTKDFGLNPNQPSSQTSSPLTDDYFSKKQLTLNFERKPTFGLGNKPEVLRRDEADVTYTYSPYSPEQMGSTGQSARYWKMKAIETKDSDINRIIGKIRHVEQKRFGHLPTSCSPDSTDRHPYKTAIDRFKQNPPPTTYKEMVYDRSRSPTSSNRLYDPKTAETNRNMINKYYPSTSTTLPSGGYSARRHPDLQSRKHPDRAHPYH